MIFILKYEYFYFNKIIKIFILFLNKIYFVYYAVFIGLDNTHWTITIYFTSLIVDMFIKKCIFSWNETVEWFTDNFVFRFRKKFYEEGMLEIWDIDYYDENKKRSFFQKTFKQAIEDCYDKDGIIFWKKGYSIIWLVFFCWFTGNYVFLFYLWAVWVI